MTQSPRPGPSTPVPGYEPDEVPARSGPPGIAITLYAVIERYAVQLAPQHERAAWIAQQNADLEDALNHMPGAKDPSVTAAEIAGFLDRMTAGHPPSVTEGLKRALADSERASTLGTALGYLAGHERASAARPARPSHPAR